MNASQFLRVLTRRVRRIHFKTMSQPCDSNFYQSDHAALQNAHKRLFVRLQFYCTGQSSDDHCDVSDGEQHISRILWTHAANRDTPCFWTTTARGPQYPHDRAYAANREVAISDFKAAWQREP
jgi:hypothetical protein